MDLSKIPPGYDVPRDVNVVIEVPLGGDPIKYEIDKASGAMFVDRFLYTPVDVLCIGRRPLIPGCVLRVKPIGVLLMEDQAGEDEKILAVPIPKLTAFYDGVESYTELPPIQIAQIEHFFAHYKDLEPGKWTKLKGWGSRADAERMILEGIERWAASPQD
jgi:inorganic pyrophosphatase